MKSNGLTLLVGLFFAAITLSAAPSANAGQCSMAGATGKYGFTLTGTLFLPTPTGPIPIPIAAVGGATLDTEGNASGTEARSVGGSFADETFTGTFTVDPDCTGASTLKFYDQSGALVRTSVLAIVFDDNMKEIRFVQKSLTLPNGTNLQVVVTAEARKIFAAEQSD